MRPVKINVFPLPQLLQRRPLCFLDVHQPERIGLLLRKVVLGWLINVGRYLVLQGLNIESLGAIDLQ